MYVCVYAHIYYIHIYIYMAYIVFGGSHAVSVYEAVVSREMLKQGKHARRGDETRLTPTSTG